MQPLCFQSTSSLVVILVLIHASSSSFSSRSTILDCAQPMKHLLKERGVPKLAVDPKLKREVWKEPHPNDIQSWFLVHYSTYKPHIVVITSLKQHIAPLRSFNCFLPLKPCTMSKRRDGQHPLSSSNTRKRDVSAVKSFEMVVDESTCHTISPSYQRKATEKTAFPMMTLVNRRTHSGIVDTKHPLIGVRSQSDLMWVEKHVQQKDAPLEDPSLIGIAYQGTQSSLGQDS